MSRIRGNWSATLRLDGKPVKDGIRRILQRLAAALNHRALRLHESLLSKRQVVVVGRRIKRPGCLPVRGKLLLRQTRYARGWSSTQGKHNRRVEMMVVVL